MHQAGVFYHDALDGALLEEFGLFDEELDDEADEEEEEEEEEEAPGPQELAGGGPLRGVLGWITAGHAPPRAPALASVRGWDERRRRLDGGEGVEASRGGAAGDATPASCEIAAADEEAARAGPPGAAGVLEKRSPSWVNGWRARSYLLQGRRLLYFRAGRPDRPLGVLDLGLVRYELHCCWPCGEEKPQGGAVAEAEAEKELRRCCDRCSAPAPASWRVFYLKPKAYPDKVFAFRGPAEEVEALTCRLSTLAATPLQPPRPEEHAIVSTRNFWRYPFICEADFRARVGSGDVLLFQGTDRAARLQRAATGARYDHVALLLRGADGEVLLLEATGGSGVAIVPWRLFLSRRWHRLYRRLAYRRVYFPRTREQLAALRCYVCSVLGRPYGLTVGKLLGRSFSDEFDKEGRGVAGCSPPGAASAEAAGDEDEEGETRTFFCSELVAACLKRCGVLAGARASSCYWPGSFGQDSPEPLPLQEHAYVGEEQLILCDSWDA